PEIRSTSIGKEIANIRIATSSSWKDKNTGERKENTEWHSIVVFAEGLVNVVKNYIKKGSKLYIEGALQTRKWQDKQGNDRYTTEIVLQGYNGTLVMLDSKNNSSGGYASNNSDYSSSNNAGGFGQTAGMFNNNSSSTNATQENKLEEIDDDIPF
ncbi:MAG: single-stranded DNA-binding protein, partial [Pseudomonadota bacterium]